MADRAEGSPLREAFGPAQPSPPGKVPRRAGRPIASGCDTPTPCSGVTTRTLSRHRGRQVAPRLVVRPDVGTRSAVPASALVGRDSRRHDRTVYEIDLSV